MRRSLDQVLAEIEISREELEVWIEESWILPAREGGEFAFDEVDVARLRLIAELRRDLAVNDEAVPLVLHLIDEVHLLRSCLTALGDALEELPAEHRDRLKRLIEASLGRG
jgi:chaperone modulatory protein CbpM